MITTIGIPLAFLVFIIAMLWIIIGVKGYWLLKLIFITVSLYFSVCLWHNLVSLQGWPTTTQIPKEFECHWIVVKEPNKRTGDKGFIHVWLTDLKPEKVKTSFILRFHHKELGKEPRVHTLPYSRTLHKQCGDIKAILGKGGRFFGGVKRGGGGHGQGQGEGEGRGTGQSGNGKGMGGLGSLSSPQEYMFYELPAPKFPEKIGS